MLNVERLRALHALSVHGSVQAAADALHVTTSAISQQLSKLEDVRAVRSHGNEQPLPTALALFLGIEIPHGCDPSTRDVALAARCSMAT